MCVNSLERSVDDRVIGICERVREKGGRALLVGGWVRDRLLGLESKDHDIEVFGLAPERLIEILDRDFSTDVVGASFGVVKILGAHIDVSIPRRDSWVPELDSADATPRNPHRAFLISTDPFMSIEDAARRRDFTINAISYDPLTREYLDPLNARRDLEQRLLRHTSDEHFAEDPLRVLRAMQFVARFELSVDPATRTLCRRIDLTGLSRERVFEEWRKLILRGQHISRGLTFLRNCEQLAPYPELAALIDCPQEPEWHPEGDVWVHTLHCMDFFAANRVGDEYDDLVVGFAVLCHDFGKPATTRVEEGRVRARGHAETGVEVTERFLRRMTDQRTLIEDVAPLVQHHLAPRQLYDQAASDAAIRRLARRVGRIDRLARVSLADAMGRPPLSSSAADMPPITSLLERAAALEVVNTAPESILKGRHLLALGVEPGPRMGEIIRACYEKQLDGEVASLDEALELAKHLLGRTAS